MFGLNRKSSMCKRTTTCCGKGWNTEEFDDKRACAKHAFTAGEISKHRSNGDLCAILAECMVVRLCMFRICSRKMSKEKEKKNTIANDMERSRNRNWSLMDWLLSMLISLYIY